MGLSRDALAVNANVSEKTILRLENNKKEPHFTLLKRIVTVLQGRIEVKFNAEYNKDNG
jgi:Predicted transcriptional regulator with C-terminal CBS domains